MTYHLVFDATDPKSPRFIELEDSTGHSISAGEWKQRKDGYVELVLPAPSGWQDIATAPRDGTRILAYNPVIGVYNTAWNQTRDCTEEGFYCGFTKYVGVWYCSPTHWMPLPEKPNEEIKS